ncbi:MAG TPA: diaminopropionate ammonia-lyase [Chloroflexia bacterium]|nr:diaminopropionate ammonia-lyase [Chloroflexia bacterium]
MKTDLFFNAQVKPDLLTTVPNRDPLEYHRRLPGYNVTPLVDAQAISKNLGLKKLWVKDESSRLGLPAFKMLGASWAVYRLMQKRLSHPLKPWNTVEQLAVQFEELRPLTLVTATDGNHGRAVARTARLLGFQAHIFVPAGTAHARIQAIEGEGATVSVVNGSYDDAVSLASQQAGERHLVISDTSWPGYEEVPGYIAEGYSTIFWEIEDELNRRGEEGPDLALVQVGVGALAEAMVRYYRCPDRSKETRLVSVEPLSAACALESARAGKLVTVPGPQDSIMAGLNCGTPSLVAWPYMSGGIDLFLAIDDERSRQAMRLLAGAGVVSGETGASGLGGLLEMLQGEHSGEIRQRLNLTEDSRVLVISTEGATDPQAYAAITGNKVL